MNFIEKIFWACLAVFILITAFGSIHDREACKARGGQLLRGPFSGYECYKAERVK